MSQAADGSVSVVPASFRDNSGFVFFRQSKLYRQVNQSYRHHFEQLLGSGLYEQITGKGLMASHREVDLIIAADANAYKVIQPEEIPFLSFPYEWCFSQLKDAALLTLQLQKQALEHGMSLKDASAYNVQFYRGKPVFIDTLSFEKYEEGQPWPAYKQFCQHFLAPLALSSKVDIRLQQLSREFIDGIPLDLASKLLPKSTWLSPALAMHLHAHAKVQTKYADSGEALNRKSERHMVSKMGLLGLIDNLESAVKGLKWHFSDSEWGDYYENTNYSDESLNAKCRLVEDFLTDAKSSAPTASRAIDLGSNRGVFSRITAKSGYTVISADIDPVAVEKNYLTCKAQGEASLLPLILDLTNPSGGIGWANEERPGFFNRSAFDVCLALALVHHLAISNNMPLPKVADFFANLSDRLIIEFVPKEDSQVKRLLASRKDIFDDYTIEGFTRAFSAHYVCEKSQLIPDTCRTLFLFRKKSN